MDMDQAEAHCSVQTRQSSGFIGRFLTCVFEVHVVST